MVNAQSNVQTLPLISAIKVESSLVRARTPQNTCDYKSGNIKRKLVVSKLLRYITLFFTFLLSLVVLVLS